MCDPPPPLSNERARKGKEQALKKNKSSFGSLPMLHPRMRSSQDARHHRKPMTDKGKNCSEKRKASRRLSHLCYTSRSLEKGIFHTTESGDNDDAFTSLIPDDLSLQNEDCRYLLDVTAAAGHPRTSRGHGKSGGCEQGFGIRPERPEIQWFSSNSDKPEKELNRPNYFGPI